MLRNNVGVIFILFVFFDLTLLSSNGSSEMLKISFVDKPAYQEPGFLFWRTNHLRIKIRITNTTDSMFAFERITPSGSEGNPMVYLKEANTESLIKPQNIVAYDYFYTDQFFIDLRPNEVYEDTVDIELLGDYDLQKDKQYKIWIEYSARYPDYEFSQKMGRPSVWSKPLLSDTLYFAL